MQVGDTVVVQTRDGASARFVVQQIEDEALVTADGRRYVRSDLLPVQRKTVSGPKTAGTDRGHRGRRVVIVAIAVGRWLADNSA